MTILKEYLQNNNISGYRLAKDNNISQSTVITFLDNDLSKLSFKHLRAIAKSVNKSIGQVANELEHLDKQKGTQN